MRHVWVTGAGRGIGAAVALAFARQGAALSLSGRDIKTLQAQAAHLKSQCPDVKVHCSVMDVIDAASVAAVSHSLPAHCAIVSSGSQLS